MYTCEDRNKVDVDLCGGGMRQPTVSTEEPPDKRYDPVLPEEHLFPMM